MAQPDEELVWLVASYCFKIDFFLYNVQAIPDYHLVYVINALMVIYDMISIEVIITLF